MAVSRNNQELLQLAVGGRERGQPDLFTAGKGHGEAPQDHASAQAFILLNHGLDLTQRPQAGGEVIQRFLVEIEICIAGKEPAVDLALLQAGEDGLRLSFRAGGSVRSRSPPLVAQSTQNRPDGPQCQPSIKYAVSGVVV